MSINAKCQNLPILETQKVEWHNDGNSFPSPIYSEQIHDFIKKFYEYELDDKNYLENKKKIYSKKIEDLDKYQILTELTYIIRGERFCDGLIATNLENGRLENLLRHLKKITNEI